MIISWLTGGLGNQMFQYAAGLALARQRQTELKLDASWYAESPGRKPHERYALDVFALDAPFATPREINRARGGRPRPLERWSGALARALRLAPPAAPGNWHAPPTFAFYPEFFAQPDNTYLHGMFQSAQFFAPVVDEIRAQFRLRAPAPPAIAALAERIRSGPSALVHFRRGDYVNDPRYAREIGVLGPGYYARATRMLCERHPDATLYIFSDDIENVAREFHPAGPHEFVRTPADTAAHDVLRLMNLCDHAIIANSSLSWWGAWLNASPNRLVIAPDPWFAGGELDTRQVVPAGWTRSPVTA
jgi:hypothetical protein